MASTVSKDQYELVGSDILFNDENQPNAAILMRSLRHLGYNNHSAIADLVDNSIDAEAAHIGVEVLRDKGDFVISIMDDGHAMDRSVLDEALKLGSNTERNAASDLGLYGMGLVTASNSIGRRLEVLTRQDVGALLRSVSDLDEIIAQNRFVKYLGVGDEADAARFDQMFMRNGLEVPSSGTIVTIGKSDGMKYSSTGHFVNALKKHLAQTFRYYLAAGKEIRVNDEALTPIDPLGLDVEGTKVFSDDVYDFKFTDGDGNEITEKFRLKMVVLPDYGVDGNRERGFDIKHQGFYVLRNNREIAEAETLGLFVKHGEFNLFRAELSVPATLDDVLGVNFTKREVKPNQAFLDKLRQVTAGQLKTIRSQRKRKVVKDERTDAHDEAARLITAKSHLLVKPKARIEERTKRDGTKESDATIDGKTTDDGRTRSNFQKTKLTKADLNCRFEQVSLGEGGQIFEAEQQGRTIIVQWNIDHPFYQRFVLDAGGDEGLVTAIDFFIWAWASAELLVYEDGKVADLLDQMKSLISMNTRTLLK
jgi:hypothetical protein